MTLRRLRPYLLLLAVLFGQWLSLAHVSEHNALEPDRSLCAYCISDIGTGGTATTAPAPPLFDSIAEAPGAQYISGLAGTPAGQPRNRGPPQYS